MLAVTDNLIGITFTRFNHVANHSTSFLAMTIIKILASNLTISLTSNSILVEYDTLLIAYCYCDVGDVFKIVKGLLHTFLPIS